MKRLFVVYNPRSSRFADVKRDVLDPIRKLRGFMIGKYEVAPTNLNDNISKLSKILKDGDLVLSAGGDATGIIASNAILKSGKDVSLAALPYGNFNDLARTLGTKTLGDITKNIPWAGDDPGRGPQNVLRSKNFGEGEGSAEPAQKYYPLEIYVDGKFFRYATCYVTIGMTAEAVELYNSPKMRQKLKKRFGRKVGSYTSLAGWYFKNRHKKQFIPEFTLNGEKQHIKTSDYAAINGRYMARVMKGGEDYKDPKIFRSETDRLANFWRLFKLMFKSVFTRIPGFETEGDILEFLSPATVTLQSEGESETFKNVHQIKIKKSQTPLKVVIASKTL